MSRRPLTGRLADHSGCQPCERKAWGSTASLRCNHAVFAGEKNARTRPCPPRPKLVPHFDPQEAGDASPARSENKHRKSTSLWTQL